jgi:hypothetical protein
LNERLVRERLHVGGSMGIRKPDDNGFRLRIVLVHVCHEVDPDGIGYKKNL